jgi:hypothetical protein
MGFFEAFFGTADTGREQQVLCPFPHTTESGIQYEESNPSAHINIEKGLFHCKACGTGLNEIQFIERILGCTFFQAQRLKLQFDNSVSIPDWLDSTELKPATMELLNSFHVSKEQAEKLYIRTAPYTDSDICIPVIMYGEIIDLRTYTPNRKPKMRSEAGSINGTMIPFDIWTETPARRLTLVCAGEKDMLVARSHGFNAITVVGGEKALPIALNMFRDRQVAIVYDNDDPGREGADNIAQFLSKATASIKVVNEFHETCCGKGEDITDFFNHYGRTRDDLIQIIENTPVFKPSAIEIGKKDVPMVTLAEATKPENIRKTLRSNVQVVSVSDQTFSCPSFAQAENRATGELKQWSLKERNLKHLLELIDSNIKESIMRTQLKKYMGINVLDKTVEWKLDILKHKTVHKADLTDFFESGTDEVEPVEFTAYCLDKKPVQGQKYMITYQLIPHPVRGSKLTMIVTDIQDSDDSVSQFSVTERVREHLSMFRDISEDPDVNVGIQAEMMKDFLNYDGDNTLITVMDLAFNTPLEFNFGVQKDIRAYLDTLVIGESRTGKSSTATMMCKLYQLGTFTSLAGNSATIPGLIGGSNGTPTQGFQIRAGIIPQNHRGLIVFEEFGKCSQNIIKELTDIRSSNQVRITRVTGSISMPAMVRMITLSNPKTVDGKIRSISSYPTGIEIVTDLIESPEDIARYDLIYIMPDTASTEINPLWKPRKAFGPEAYQDRIRWIWTRTSDQIYIQPEVLEHIVNESNKLNELYAAHIKIFGTETWKKLSRLSIAIAGYVCSSDERFNLIVVNKSHVNLARDILIALYDNEVFKLKQFVDGERMFTEIDDSSVALLQEIHDKWHALTLQLELVAETSANTLVSSTGYQIDEVNTALGRLTQGKFIRTTVNGKVHPTERFRKAMSQVTKQTYLKRVGE